MKYSWGYTTQLSSAECLQNIKKKKKKEKGLPSLFLKHRKEVELKRKYLGKERIQMKPGKANHKVLYISVWLKVSLLSHS